jgi:hypothetical protein
MKVIGNMIVLMETDFINLQMVPSTKDNMVKDAKQEKENIHIAMAQHILAIF